VSGVVFRGVVPTPGLIKCYIKTPHSKVLNEDRVVCSAPAYRRDRFINY